MGAVSPFASIFAAVDFAGIGIWVGTAGVAVIGITMAFQAIVIARRAVTRA